MILINGHVIEFKTFGNGEVEPDTSKILPRLNRTGTNELTLKYQSDADLILLQFVKDFLIEEGLVLPTLMGLRIAYMPYSRMDRTHGTDKVFTLKTIARMINNMNFAWVTVYEPHSDVTPALLNRVRPIEYTKLMLKGVLQKVGFNKDTDYLFYPDAGAQKRYFLPGYKSLSANKKRNFDTGAIESLELTGTVEAGAKVVILDDLCSYGGTFLRSGEALKQAGASEVHMIVTHCEDCIFDGKLLTTDIIDSIHTTDTILSDDISYPSKLHVEKIITGRKVIIK